MPTDPKKKAQDSTKSQIISDKLAHKVAKGLMSHKQAMKIQRKNDSIKMATVKTVKKIPTGALQSSVKARPAKFRRNNKGEIESY